MIAAPSRMPFGIATALLLASSAGAQDAFGSDDPLALTRAMLPFAGSTVVASSQDTTGVPSTDDDGFTFWDTDRPDRDSPYGVMNTQVLDVGQWLVSYTYQYQSFDRLRDSRDNLGPAQLFAAGFTVASTGMDAETHQLQALYGWDGDWTMFATLPIHVREMDNVTSGGNSFSTRSSGIGDLILGGIRTVGEIDGEIVRVHFGLEIPTGSIDETDADATGTERILPFRMQPGSGTFNLRPGITYQAQLETWSWGVQGHGRVHIEKNSDDWAVGDRFDLSLWAQRPLSDNLAGSLRFDYHSWGDYHGQSTARDPGLTTGPDPTRNPIESLKNQGGTRADVVGGFNLDLDRAEGRTNRLALEIGVPIDQWLDGPQLALDWLATFGWQLSF